jgi:chromosome partitioning protein
MQGQHRQMTRRMSMAKRGSLVIGPAVSVLIASTRRSIIGVLLKIFVPANQKGGVGKSFIAAQFSFYLAQGGKRVLQLDLDHQGNSSAPLVRSGLAAVAPFCASEVLIGVARAVPEAPFVVVPGDMMLSTLERQPERHNDFVANLQDFLSEVADRFDVCVIDTNPNPDIRYAAALIVADYVVSPVELNQEALDGIGALFHHPRYGIYKIKKLMNPGLSMIGILPNMVEATHFQRTNLTELVKAYHELLIALPGEAVKYAFIPARTAIAEAQAAGVPLWNLRTSVPPAQAGKIDPLAMPVRTSAREAWREIRPVFAELERRMGLEG